MSAEVLRRGTDRYLTVVNHKSHFRPLVQRVDVHAAIDQRLSKISTTRLQRVRADRHWSLNFVGFQEVDDLSATEDAIVDAMRQMPYLGERKEIEQFIHEEVIVGVVVA